MIQDEKREFELKESIEILFQKKTIKESVEYFLSLQKKPYIYLKWLPHMQAFKVIKSKPFIEKDLLRLYESSSQFNLNQLRQPLQIDAVQKLVRKVAGDRPMFAYNTFYNDQLCSLFILSEKTPEIDFFVRCLDKQCECLSWKDKNSAPASRQQFLKILLQEVQRARQWTQPVSLLLVSLISKDTKIKGSVDVFFESLRRHLSKNLNLYDIVFQIQSTELGIVLPHISIQQATQRAQKLSWMLESIDYKSMLNVKGSMKFQIGVAEYPTTSRDAMDLLKKAELSRSYMEEGFSNGGVCIATTIKGFQPDFQIKDQGISFENNK